MKKLSLLFCLVTTFVLLSGASAVAQNQPANLLEQERLKKASQFKEIAEPFYLDFGFWHKFGYYHYQDPGSGLSEHDKDLRLHSLFGWGEVVLEKQHRFYVRFATVSLDYSKGDHGRWDHRIYLPRLDMGFYEFRQEKAKGEIAALKYFQFRVGRQLLKIGSGLTYYRVHDGISASGLFNSLEAKFFFAQSIPSEDNIDQTKPQNSRQRRNFYGLQLAYDKLQNHTPYFYLLLQRDRQGDNIPFANFIFHSNYFGIGSKGSLGKMVNYHAEYIYCTGRRHSDPSLPSPQTTEPIRAVGFDSKVEFLLEGKNDALLSFQYMLGEGDRDRQSPTDTGPLPFLGNEPGTDDTSFVPFGKSDTGYALYPIVSNLHVYRVEFSAVPLPDNPDFKDLRVGAVLLKFIKQKPGGISTRSGQSYDRRNVGWEIDLYANWQVFSDFAVTLKYGHFRPGSAFPSDFGLRRNLDYYFMGTTISF